MEQEEIEMQAFVEGFIAGISEFFALPEDELDKYRKLARNLFKQRQLTKENNQ